MLTPPTAAQLLRGSDPTAEGLCAPHEEVLGVLEPVISFGGDCGVLDVPRVCYAAYRTNANALPADFGEHAADFRELPADEQEWARGRIERDRPRLARCCRQADGSWLLDADHDFRRASRTFGVSAEAASKSTIQKSSEA